MWQATTFSLRELSGLDWTVVVIGFNPDYSRWRAHSSLPPSVLSCLGYFKHTYSCRTRLLLQGEWVHVCSVIRTQKSWFQQTYLMVCTTGKGLLFLSTHADFTYPAHSLAHITFSSQFMFVPKSLTAVLTSAKIRQYEVSASRTTPLSTSLFLCCPI